MRMKMSRIDELIRNVSSVGISGHVRPDGDCIGSVMALYLYIKKNWPEIETKVFLEKPAEIFRCIKGVDEIDSEMKSDKVYDVFFVLDTAALYFAEISLTKSSYAAGPIARHSSITSPKMAALVAEVGCSSITSPAWTLSRIFCFAASSLICLALSQSA